MYTFPMLKSLRLKRPTLFSVSAGQGKIKYTFVHLVSTCDIEHLRKMAEISGVPKSKKLFLQSSRHKCIAKKLQFPAVRRT